MPEKPEAQVPAVNGDAPSPAESGANSEILAQVRRQEDLTLTDHVNRRLLTSFLSRINNQLPEAAGNPPSTETSSSVSAPSDNDDFAA